MGLSVVPEVPQQACLQWKTIVLLRLSLRPARFPLLSIRGPARGPKLCEILGRVGLHQAPVLPAETTDPDPKEDLLFRRESHVVCQTGDRSGFCRDQS